MELIKDQYKDVQIVMEGLKSINYNKQSYEQNSLSMFKTSYNGLEYLSKHNPKDFSKALELWLQIVETQILNISGNDYTQIENLSQNPNFSWLKSLSKLKYREGLDLPSTELNFSQNEN